MVNLGKQVYLPTVQHVTPSRNRGQGYFVSGEVLHTSCRGVVGSGLNRAHTYYF